MCEYLKVIKFNNEYFENGTVVAVTEKDGETTVGSIVTSLYTGDNVSVDLDVSEQYHRKTINIALKEIDNIQKVE